MTNEKRLIVRSVRLTQTINKKLEQIAAFEDRTISKTIQRLLDKAVWQYHQNLSLANPDFIRFVEKWDKVDHYEELYEYEFENADNTEKEDKTPE